VLAAVCAQHNDGVDYEVIVVDDGSTDRTSELVSEFPVRVVRHEVCRGIAAARNTGLRSARGDIYVSLDDDCVPEDGWLPALLKSLNADPAVVGAGGAIRNADGPGLAGGYLEAIGYGRPVPLGVEARGPALRFANYLKMMAASHQDAGEVQVLELAGSNSAFRRDALTAIGGWDEALDAAEDSDLCARLRERFPDSRLVFNPEAVVVHEHGLSVREVVRRAYDRGPARLRAARRTGKTAPIFPFPVVVGFGVSLACVHGVRAAIATFVLLPQVVCPWWAVRATRQRDPAQLLYPYVQIAWETATDLGVLRGYLSSIDRARVSSGSGSGAGP